MSDQTVAAVRTFSRFYTRQLGILDEGLLDSPYTLTEVRVMYEIAHGEDVSAMHLTEQLRIDPGYLSRIIRKLEKAGLIKRNTCSQDRRRSILALTAKGSGVFAKLDIQQDRDVAELVSGLSKRKQKQLVRAMRLVENSLVGEREELSPAVLRQPEPGDVGWIVHRFSRLFWEEYGYDERFEGLVAGIASDFLKAPVSGRRCWIAERDGEILGAVMVMKRTRRIAQLRLLYVEPPERGQGLGERLVEEAIAFARDAGYRDLMLWTQHEEKPARHLYRRLGFELTSKHKHRDFTDRQIVAETWQLGLGD